MSIAFCCSYCGRRLEFPQGQAGQSVACECGVAVRVPNPKSPRRRGPRPESTGKQIALDCPRCKKRFTVDEAAAGRKMKCPCGQRFVVPARKAPSSRPKPRPATKPGQTATPPAATISFNCNHCRKRFVLSVDLAGQKGRCDCGLAYVVPPIGGAKSAPKPAGDKPKGDKDDTPPHQAPVKQVIFRCPRCDRRIAVPTIHAGRKANCTCGARFVVPTRGGRSPRDLNKPAPAEKT